MKKDLDELLETNVELVLHDKFTSTTTELFTDFKDITELVDMNSIECTKFNDAPEELEYDENNKEIKIMFKSLRSNCRVTHQPDFGTAFVQVKCEKGVDLKGLVRYLVSFRKEWHFHEECCEMIYKRLLDKYNPEDLMVACLYTRRGGIDICPMRANRETLLDKELSDINKYTKRTINQ